MIKLRALALTPESDNTINLYPNPTCNMLYSRQPARQIEIFSLNGVKLNETNESEILVSGLQNGCYIARIRTMNGTYNQLFIKK
ncbi:MAG: T9SS type A sorting domain-containing protein [Paludibacter sp.]|nr:T9SS type A sorting domain-containing protein [Paludibacter sp.]